MFCGKCGTKLVEGAVFCQKCGSKVHNEKAENLDVILNVAGPNKEKVIRVARDLTGLELKEAKDLVDHVPALLKKNVTGVEAESVKAAFRREGAVVTFKDQKGNDVGITLHCGSCGSVVDDSSEICKSCGSPLFMAPPREGSDPKLAENSPFGEEPPAEQKTSKFKSWWDNCSKAKKVLTVVAVLLVGIFVLRFLVSFLREFGPLLFGVLVIASLIYAIRAGSKEERSEARKTLLQLIIGGAFIIIIVLVVVVKQDFFFDIIQPGAGVRNAYLSQYSDEVTIEEAFDNYFDSGKWSKYEGEGYTYIVFTGVCEYSGDRADVRITFKITGENFIVDSLDLNGQTQNDFMLYLLLESVYEDY